MCPSLHLWWRSFLRDPNFYIPSPPCTLCLSLPSLQASPKESDFHTVKMKANDRLLFMICNEAAICYINAKEFWKQKELKSCASLNIFQARPWGVRLFGLNIQMFSFASRVSGVNGFSIRKISKSERLWSSQLNYQVFQVFSCDDWLGLLEPVRQSGVFRTCCWWHPVHLHYVRFINTLLGWHVIFCWM